NKKSASNQLAIFSGALRFSVRSALNPASQRPSAQQINCYIEKSVIVSYTALVLRLIWLGMYEKNISTVLKIKKICCILPLNLNLSTKGVKSCPLWWSRKT
ncbi:MAG: hypothetical protein IJV89_03130, partial [Lentisphaeria bacterium]|nr:hypothetical protein [Lentisphaeria bacterium]